MLHFIFRITSFIQRVRFNPHTRTECDNAGNQALHMLEGNRREADRQAGGPAERAHAERIAQQNERTAQEIQKNEEAGGVEERLDNDRSTLIQEGAAGHKTLGTPLTRNAMGLGEVPQEEIDRLESQRVAQTEPVRTPVPVASVPVPDPELERATRSVLSHDTESPRGKSNLRVLAERG